MRFDAEEMMALMAGYIEKHPLAVDSGSEYIMQDGDAQADAVQLVCDIFDKMTNLKQKDVFKGWVKLKTPKSTIRIDASKIVALAPILSDAAAESTGAITKVYTIGAEWNPWLVCESVDEVMEKIEKAKQEK